jgi:succinyl-CoA synthetase alpha subunit
MRQQEKAGIETRKRTEKDYFLRRIDEQTFREIMVREQEKIMHLRSEIADAEERLARLVRAKLSPKAVVSWILGLPKTIGRNLFEACLYSKKIYRFVKSKLEKARFAAFLARKVGKGIKKGKK